tara:strand:- start:292 stop:537 length:246 start_codon:yes stop_codon:yes gene_type:complete
MRAGDVFYGGLVAVLVDDIPHIGIRVRNDSVAEVIHMQVPDNIVSVQIHHKRSLRRAFVGVDVNTEFEILPEDINPYRQLN